MCCWFVFVCLCLHVVVSCVGGPCLYVCVCCVVGLCLYGRACGVVCLCMRYIERRCKAVTTMAEAIIVSNRRR
jgi:hypothetical protein